LALDCVKIGNLELALEVVLKILKNNCKSIAPTFRSGKVKEYIFGL